MDKKIKNPLTGHLITKNGPTHLSLIKKGVLAKSPKRKSPSPKKSPLKFNRKRKCGPIKSKKNPDAYSKDELVEIAIKKLKLSKSQATKLTKEELCKRLSAKRKSKSPKKPKSPKKTKSPKKAKSPKKPKSPVKPKSPIKKKSPKPKNPKIKITKSPVLKSPKPTVPLPVKKTDCIGRSKIPLLDHQIRVVEYMKNHRGLIVVHSVGSGKTLTAVASTQCYLDSAPDNRVIVVTPLSLLKNFRKELKAYGVSDDEVSKFYTFYTLQGFMNEFRDKDPVKEMKKTMLVIDEAHNLRTAVTVSKKTDAIKTSRSSVATEFAREAEKVLLLTATPFYNKVNDLINLLEMVTKKDYPKKPFTDAFGSAVYALNALKKIDKEEAETNNNYATSFFNKDYLELAKKSNNEYYERMKEDHKHIIERFTKLFKCHISFYNAPKNSFYPKVTEENVEIPMSAAYYREYRAIELGQSKYYYSAKPFAYLTGVRMACNAIAECMKCDFVMDVIKRKEKTLIYSAYVSKGVNVLQKLFKEKDVKYYEITGKSSESDRAKAVEKFNDEKEGVKTLFITKAGGEGLDLKGVRYVIIFESSWNRPNEEQIIGRAVRYMSHTHLPADERTVTVYHLIIVKPEHAMGEKPSADTMLQAITRYKFEEQQAFIDLVAPVSIEQTKCGESPKPISPQSISPNKKLNFEKLLEILKERADIFTKSKKKDHGYKLFKNINKNNSDIKKYEFNEYFWDHEKDKLIPTYSGAYGNIEIALIIFNDNSNNFLRISFEEYKEKSKNPTVVGFIDFMQDNSSNGPDLFVKDLGLDEF